MMHTSYGVPPAGPLPLSYSQDALLDDISRQMAISQASRRLSRGSNGQRSGTTMRVVKPSSANNSPRSSTMMGRRKTLMNDGSAQRRQQQVLEQVAMYYGTEQQQPVKRPSRPVSWHPNSYAQQLQPQVQQPVYTLATATMYPDQQDTYATYPYLSPMMGSHSCNTSPSSAFSPLSLPFQPMNTMQYPAMENSAMPGQSPVYPSMSAPQLLMEGASASDDLVNEQAAYGNGWDWNSFVMHGFNTTTPPTPEAFPQVQLSQPTMSEESISYQSLEEPLEEEGEILVGMGLYDTPDKYEDDPQLNNYRSTVSSLLGSTFRTQEPEGKGLKLEETWEPPKSEDEDDEDDDEESETTSA